LGFSGKEMGGGGGGEFIRKLVFALFFKSYIFSSRLAEGSF